MKLNITTTALFVVMIILFLGGTSLVLGIMEDFTLPAFIIVKSIGLIAMYFGYNIFKANFKKHEIFD